MAYHPPQHKSSQQQLQQQQQLHALSSSSSSFSPASASSQSPPIQYNPLPAPPLTSTSPYSLNTQPTPSFAVHHPLAVQSITLEPPRRNFGTIETRPTSVASYSNFSTHSNEPLNPSYSYNPSQKTKSEKMQTQAAARSLTPQPWHPDYNRNSRSQTPNPLDLPEHRRGHDSSELGSGLSEIDDDKNNKNEKKGKKGVLNKTRKYISSRLGRRRTTTSQVTYKVSGTGRMAQFSNERLFLHWIRFGILQGSIAMTLLSFGYNVAAYIGVGALVLALTTLIYGATTYHVRHIHMITKRKDVVYYERAMPTILCVGLIILYAANFVVTLSIGEAATSPSPWS